MESLQQKKVAVNQRCNKKGGNTCFSSILKLTLRLGLKSMGGGRQRVWILKAKISTTNWNENLQNHQISTKYSTGVPQLPLELPLPHTHHFRQRRQRGSPWISWTFQTEWHFHKSGTCRALTCDCEQPVVGQVSTNETYSSPGAGYRSHSRTRSTRYISTRECKTRLSRSATGPHWTRVFVIWSRLEVSASKVSNPIFQSQTRNSYVTGSKSGLLI